MKLSETTLSILQNFAKINTNIVFNEGKVVKTVSEAKNIFGQAEIDEEFESQLGIYDLNEFLSALSLIPSADLSIDGKSITITDGKVKLSYTGANPEILTHPSKDIKDPEYEINVSITQDNLIAVRKAGSVLGCAEVAIVSDPGSEEIYLVVSDSGNSSSNKYSCKLDDTCGTELEFDFKFNIVEHLKIINGSYQVSLSSKFISKWEHTTLPLKYWIALEQTSSYSPF